MQTTVKQIAKVVSISSLVFFACQRVLAETRYVSLAGGHVSPYASWADAATNIQNAVDVATAGDTVLVTNGTYLLPDTVNIIKGITVRSVNGYNHSIVDGDHSVMCVFMNHTNALAEGFTIIKGKSSYSGGGVNMYNGGILQNCLVIGNSAQTAGGVRVAGESLVRNCLISVNSANRGGGAECAYGGVMENCTIIGNRANYSGGVIIGYSATIVNSIIYFNEAAVGANYQAGKYSANCMYSCTIPATGGAGVITNSPQLLSFYNPHITAGSPCIDAGTNAYATGVDIDNEPRIFNGTTDMGCDEYISAGITGLLSAAIHTESTTGTVDFSVKIESRILGKAIGSVWNYGDGSTGVNMAVCEHVYGGAGTYNVILQAWNNDLAVSATTAITIVNAYTNYVSLSGSHQAPFTSWSNAATNIQDAIDAALPGNTVLVANGVYYLQTNVFVRKGVCVKGANGAHNVVIDGQHKSRCFWLENPRAVIDELTITNGYADDSWHSGGGVLCLGSGEIRNCIIRGNESAWYGGGAYFVGGGSLTNSTVEGNSSASGGGVYCYLGGIVVDSTISNNLASDDDGGGVYLDMGGIVRRCNVSGNTANAEGGGVYCDEGGNVEHCIIRDNMAPDSGGGVFCDEGGTISYCTIDGNRAQTGGGVECNLGTVENCTITGNWVTADGGGVECYGDSLVVNCTISGNSAVDWGGGVACFNGAVVRNCLLNRNTVVDLGGGVYCNEGVVENCTIVSNTARIGGGLFCFEKGTTLNTIIYFNDASIAGNNVYDQKGIMTYSHTCSSPTMPGTRNIGDAPGFADDYKLRPGSSCINAGTNELWMVTAKDLGGYDRIIDNVVDMGAHEFDGNAGGLVCNAVADTRQGFSPFAAVFKAFAAGADTSALYYYWDFNNDGVIDLEGWGLDTATNMYQLFGYYSVRLVVSNAAGEVATVVWENFIKVGPQVAYVSPAGPEIYPFTNWVMAATNIQSAVDVGVDGTVVMTSNGTYFISLPISVENGITVRSLSGPDETIVDANHATGCFVLSHADAVVDGLTITRGNDRFGGGVFCKGGGLITNCVIIGNNAFADSWFSGGGGVYCNFAGKAMDSIIAGNSAVYEGGGVFCNGGGTVQNCTIISNMATYYGDGAGVFCDYGGTVTNCFITRNEGSYGDGPGVYCMGGGIVQSCLIISNLAGWSGGGVFCDHGGTVENTMLRENTCAFEGGGVCCDGGGTVRNCIITGNSAAYPIDLRYGKGGGVYCKQGGTVQNCTISHNSAAATNSGGGGVYCYRGGVVENSIIYFNSASNGPNYYNELWYSSVPAYSHCCSTPALTGQVSRGGNITNNPMFTDVSAQDYHLLEGSPCIDAGTNMAWMTGATDFGDNPRIAYGTVDMGAYEYVAGLYCDFYADRTNAVVDETVNFTSQVGGTNISGIYYRWDFENDGVVDVQGSAESAPPWLYHVEGAYSIALTVSNAVGEVATTVRQDYITVVPEPGFIGYWLLIIWLKRSTIND